MAQVVAGFCPARRPCFNQMHRPPPGLTGLVKPRQRPGEGRYSPGAGSCIFLRGRRELIAACSLGRFWTTGGHHVQPGAASMSVQNDVDVQLHVSPGRATAAADTARQLRSIAGEASHCPAPPGAEPTAVHQILCGHPLASLCGWPAQRQMGLQQVQADKWKRGQPNSYSHLDHHPTLMQAAGP